MIKRAIFNNSSCYRGEVIFSNFLTGTSFSRPLISRDNDVTTSDLAFSPFSSTEMFQILVNLHFVQRTDAWLFRPSKSISTSHLSTVRSLWMAAVYGSIIIYSFIDWTNWAPRDALGKIFSLRILLSIFRQGNVISCIDYNRF